MIYLRTWELRQFVGFPTAEICPYLESYGGREWGATAYHRDSWAVWNLDNRQRVYVFADPLPDGLFTTVIGVM